MVDDAEKTQHPTPKKIEDARREGNVPRSQDLLGAITLVVAVFSMVLFFPFVLEHMFLLFRYYFSLVSAPFNKELVLDVSIVSIREFLFMVLPFALSVAIGGIVASVVQFGFVFSTKPIMFDINKINPIVGAKNLFSLKKFIEGVKITLKSFITLGIGFGFLFLFADELHSVSLFGLGGELEWFSSKAIAISLITLLVISVFALVDLFIVRKYYFHDLRMSKQEIKDEIKNMHGDPTIRSNIRQVQIELSRNTSLDEVLNATLVIVDAQEYAIAIKYDEHTQKTPVVVFKGRNLIAKKIIQKAKENKIVIVQNSSLAKSLYSEVGLGGEIPRKFFNVVAEILAHHVTINKI